MLKRKRVLSAVLVLAIVASLFMGPAFVSKAEPANLALSKTAAASSYQGGNTPSAAFDGNMGTRWESTQGVDPQWISVDLGSSVSITGVKLSWETAAGKDYKIQVSTDNVNWNDAYVKTGGTGGTENITFASAVTGQYVRMYGTARTTGYGYSLWEFEVYGTQGTVTKVETPAITPATGTYSSPQTITITDSTAGATIRYTTDGSAPTASTGTVYSGTFTVSATTTIKAIAVKSGMTDSDIAASTITIGTVSSNLALNRTAAASSGTAGLAFDGNTDTRWESTQGVDPQWISVDLGSSVSVTGVKLNWETAAGKDYKIQVSADNANWNDAYVKTGGTGGIENITFASAVTGQYVRMYGTARTTGYGYSLWEFEVYGTQGTVTKVATPAITPATGTYSSSQTVTITDSTAGATIRYTTDGSTPTASAGTVYSGPFTVSATTTVKAVAYKSGMTNSDVAASTITIGTVSSNLALNKSAAASSGTAGLAFDGNTDTRWESTQGVDPQWISVDLGSSASITGVKLNWETAAGKDYKIQVSADNANWNDAYVKTGGTGGIENITFASAVTGQYVRMYGTARTTGYGYSLWEFEVYGTQGTVTKVATPAITPATGTYSSSQTVTITDSTAGATIRYTTDGSTPTASAGTVYSGSFTVSATTTVKAIAYKSGMTNSDVAASTITISGGTLPAVPAGLTVTSVTNNSIGLSWSPVAGATGYNVYRSFSGNGTYVKVNSSPVTAASYTATALDTATYYYKVSAVNAGGESALSASVFATTTLDFGASVKIFDPSMSNSTIQSTCDTIFAQMESNQFGSERYALLFKPGSYNVNVSVGFYTQVAGLGQRPDDVNITGSVRCESDWWEGNSTLNFWRSIENLADIPTYSSSPVAPAGTETWAVAQAAPMRRVHIKGSLTLWDPNPSNYDGSWASGGYIADSLIDNQVSSGSQQQFFTRNSQMGSWSGSNWNMVFVGDTGAPADAYPNPAYTVVNQAPVIREKPFLYIDGTGNYSVFVPAVRNNAQGITWANGIGAGTSLSLSSFIVAHPETSTAATLNQALADGKNIIFTPGIYHLSEALNVTRTDTVILGIGLPTLLPDNGTAAMTVADVDGVKIAGIFFEAGVNNSPVLLEVGPAGSSANHSANPTTLSDLFFRVGGAFAGKADVSIRINSNNVIGDHFWVWRADHGEGAGWNSNTTKNGLVVNGNNVTLYGMFVEHYHQYQTLWNGNGGRLYFYQSEIPYDVPSQASWMDGAENGYASYRVADTVTSHEAWGLGIYSFFRDADVKLNSAIKVPNNPGVKIHHACSVFLAGNGEVTHVINNTGDAAKLGNMRQTVTEYPLP